MATNSGHRSSHTGDRSVADLPTCPTCGDACPPDATRCECGEKLTPRAPDLTKPAVVVAPYGCTCGGNGLCTACELAQYEGENVGR